MRQEKGAHPPYILKETHSVPAVTRHRLLRLLVGVRVCDDDDDDDDGGFDADQSQTILTQRRIP